MKLLKEYKPVFQEVTLEQFLDQYLEDFDFGDIIYCDDIVEAFAEQIDDPENKKTILNNSELVKNIIKTKVKESDNDNFDDYVTEIIRNVESLVDNQYNLDPWIYNPEVRKKALAIAIQKLYDKYGSYKY